jgi:hypothetical protein
VVPYSLAGKLGITVPLALIGVGLIARDLLANAGTGGVRTTTAPARTRRAVPKADDDLEVGEPIPEELATPAAPIPAARKIPVGPTRRPAAGTPSAPPVDAGGGMVLSSAKYLSSGNNGAGGARGNFRTGRTHHTTPDDVCGARDGETRRGRGFTRGPACCRSLLGRHCLVLMALASGLMTFGMT